jgi:hypothetical protein
VSVPCPTGFSQFFRLVFLSVGFAGLAHAWQPGSGHPGAADGFAVDTTDRRDVLAFHHAVYGASQQYAANLNWTGNISTGNAGTTSGVFKEDVRRRINYYRALGGGSGGEGV